MTFLESSADFSPCRLWRYGLRRVWDRSKPVCAFIGLNPSIADETRLDPTLRRCVGFADAWGFGELTMLNAFAFVATDPARMMVAGDPVGERNDFEILREALRADIVVAAWGNLAAYQNRHETLRGYFHAAGIRGKMRCLGLTASGAPRHPLYMPKATKPFPFFL